MNKPLLRKIGSLIGIAFARAVFLCFVPVKENDPLFSEIITILFCLLHSAIMCVCIVDILRKQRLQDAVRIQEPQDKFFQIVQTKNPLLSVSVLLLLIGLLFNVLVIADTVTGNADPSVVFPQLAVVFLSSASAAHLFIYSDRKDVVIECSKRGVLLHDLPETDAPCRQFQWEEVGVSLVHAGRIRALRGEKEDVVLIFGITLPDGTAYTVPVGESQEPIARAISKLNELIEKGSDPENG